MLGGNLGKISKLGRLFTGGINCDPYFGNVALLLHMDGTNGSTSFPDSSSTNKTITRFGAAAVNTTIFKYGTGSVFLNGSNSYLSTPGSSTFRIATSTTPFTIEAWIYPTAAGGVIFSESFPGSGNVAIALTMGDGTQTSNTTGRILSLGWYNGSAWTNAAFANTNVQLNTWQHVAAVFTGSTTKIFIDGVDVTKTSSPTPASTWGVVNDAGNEWYIGRRWDTFSTPYFTGYIDDFRFTTGIARYTSNFTPPMAAFPNNDCNFTSFIDLTDNIYPTVPIPSSFNFTTLNIHGLNVAAIPTSYNFSTLNIPDLNVAAIPTSYNFSTLNVPNYPVTSTKSDINKFFTSNLSTINYTLSDSTAFYTTSNSTINYTLSDSTAFYTSVNSTIGYTLSDSTAFYASSVSTIGCTLSAADPESSTDPNFSSVSLLLHLDNVSGSTTTTDVSSSPKTITFNGTSQTINNNTRDTTNNLYVTTNGYITAAPGSGLITATGDFTIELWFNSSLAAQGVLFYIDGNTTPTSTSFNRLSVYIGASSTIVFYTESAARITSSANIFSVNTWNHVALTRATNVYRLFVNGNLINSFTRTSSQSSTTNNLQIGGYSGATSTEFLTGWIDEVRVTNGVARYTAAFDPRLQPFPNSA